MYRFGPCRTFSSTIPLPSCFRRGQTPSGSLLLVTRSGISRLSLKRPQIFLPVVRVVTTCNVSMFQLCRSTHSRALIENYAALLRCLWHTGFRSHVIWLEMRAAVDRTVALAIRQVRGTSHPLRHQSPAKVSPLTPAKVSPLSSLRSPDALP
jgi:hypothetical protein